MAELNARYVVVEGAEAVGKSTLTHKLAAQVEKRYGIEARAIREPGETAIGSVIRDELLHGETTQSPVALACSFAHDNSITAHEVVRPHLADPNSGLLVSDRGLPSAIAYQYGGYQLPEKVMTDIYFPLRVIPDLTLMLMPDTFDTWQEMFQQRMDGKKRDNIESMGMDFHKRVFDCYQQIITGRWSIGEFVVIDPTQSANQIVEEALRHVIKGDSSARLVTLKETEQKYEAGEPMPTVEVSYSAGRRFVKEAMRPYDADLDSDPKPECDFGQIVKETDTETVLRHTHFSLLNLAAAAEAWRQEYSFLLDEDEPLCDYQVRGDAFLLVKSAQDTLTAIKQTCAQQNWHFDCWNETVAYGDY